MSHSALPPDFLLQLRELEGAYLKEVDPIRQSGFSGGPQRWRTEREPILEPIRQSGDLLDLGCANGYLLESLVAWAEERGIRLTPFGVDQSPGLIELARQRLPQYADHFYVANTWEWQPPRRYRYVYSVHDCVPEQFLQAYVARLLRDVVAPGGLLILGAYGSRTRGVEPLALRERLISFGLVAAGGVAVGQPPISRFVWLAA
jgi:SAM-dependent methyltransferase